MNERITCEYVDTHIDALMDTAISGCDQANLPGILVHVARCDVCRESLRSYEALLTLVREHDDAAEWGNESSITGVSNKNLPTRRARLRWHWRRVAFLVLSLIPTAFAGSMWGRAQERELLHEPASVFVTDGDGEAILLSKGGHILHRWRSGEPRGIAAEMITRPDELGGGAVVAVAYTATAQEHAGELRVFDAAGNYESPLWTARVQDEELPTELEGAFGEQFNPRYLFAGDIAPDNAGPELVAVFQHAKYSPCSIRVYGLDGTLLFDVFHWGNVTALAWLEDSGLLACSGLNGEADAEQRRMPKLKIGHPRVVFAFKPELGDTAPGWLTTVDRKGKLDPAFYHVLNGPKEALDQVQRIRLASDRVTVQGQELLLCTPQFTGPKGRASFAMFLTPEGQELRELRSPSDVYRRQQESLPDPDVFELIPLPRIVDRDEGK